MAGAFQEIRNTVSSLRPSADGTVSLLVSGCPREWRSVSRCCDRRGRTVRPLLPGFPVVDLQCGVFRDAEFRVESDQFGDGKPAAGVWGMLG